MSWGRDGVRGLKPGFCLSFVVERPGLGLVCLSEVLLRSPFVCSSAAIGLVSTAPCCDVEAGVPWLGSWSVESIATGPELGLIR